MASPTRDDITRLLQKRIVVLGAEITDEVATVVIAQLLFLQSEDGAREISLYLDSPGGAVGASLAIDDAIQSLSAPVSTRALGQAAGTAALLLSAGSRGRRLAGPGARIALLPTRGGPASSADALLRLDGEVRDRLAECTGRPAVIIAAAMERGVWLSPLEARELGIVDEIVTGGLSG